MHQVQNADRRLDDHVLRALNQIRKPSRAEEIAELLNRDLSPGDRPFQAREVATWPGNAMRQGAETVLAGDSSPQIDPSIPTGESCRRIPADATSCFFR